MLLQLKRRWFTNDSTTGVLIVDGQHFCFTLEDVARPEGVKIPKETCIAAGEYDVEIDFSNRFQRTMPHVMWVHLFDGVRFHWGNNEFDTEACILVGYQRGPDTIWESRKAFDDLFAKMQEAVDRDEKIRLVITNEQL